MLRLIGLLLVVCVVLLVVRFLFIVELVGLWVVVLLDLLA